MILQIETKMQTWSKQQSSKTDWPSEFTLTSEQTKSIDALITSYRQICYRSSVGLSMMEYL